MKITFFPLLTFLFITHAFAGKLNIADFYKNPAKYYYSTPTKKYPAKAYAKKIDRKFQKSAPFSNDNVRKLFPYDRIEQNLVRIDKFNIFKSEAKTSPWSDDYWPIYKGIAAARYAVADFNSIYNWNEAFNYVERLPYHSSESDAFLDNLSPAEKFDLLLGEDFLLTQKMWETGKKYFDRSGSVEKWMGICHGWAPASIMTPRPKHAIEVKAFDGRSIRFYPSDLKALSSLLWANGKYESFFIGGRCRTSSPERDDTGRIIQRDCRDNNAATFFLAVTHGLGVKKESFVIDATFDYEVWNQPLKAYEFNYFNPLTQVEGRSLNHALIKLADFKDDPFKNYRHPNARYLIGVQMELQYIVETSPTHLNYDSEKLDLYNSAQYSFDLELDHNFNIIGGEWYHDQHPDFLWRPKRHTRALSQFDLYLMSEPKWSGASPLSLKVRNLAKRSALKGIPLAFIVNSLIKKSNQEIE